MRGAETAGIGEFGFGCDAPIGTGEISNSPLGCGIGVFVGAEEGDVSEGAAEPIGIGAISNSLGFVVVGGAFGFDPESTVGTGVASVFGSGAGSSSRRGCGGLGTDDFDVFVGIGGGANGDGFVVVDFGFDVFGPVDLDGAAAGVPGFAAGLVGVPVVGRRKREFVGRC